MLWRKEKLRFFLGSHKKREFRVFVSQIFIPQKGQVTLLSGNPTPITFGVDGIPRSYYGAAVPFGEVDIAANYRILFQRTVAGVSDLPNPIKKLLFTDVDVQIVCSPFIKDFVLPEKPFVAFGSPAYNASSDWIQNNLNPRIRFTRDNSGIEVELDNGKKYTTKRHNNCFVSRMLRENGVPVFYVAGLNERATVCAAMFLLKEWASICSRGARYDNISYLIEFSFDNPHEYDSIECIRYYHH